MTLGEKILALRKARGWSQEDLAGRIGVTRQALSRWESDAAIPDTVNVVQLADLFGVSTDYLLRDGRTQERPDLPAEGKAKERRILAWVITALGAVGTLTTLIVGCLLNPKLSGWGSEFEEWFLVWSTRNLLWLPPFLWVMLAGGIVLLHFKKVKKEVKDFFRVLMTPVEELSNEENKK